MAVSVANAQVPGSAGGVKPPAVAGMFYATDPAALAAEVDGYIGRAAAQPFSPKAVIAPHAGFAYSGAVAGSAYALLAKRRGTISRVVILGPAHRVAVPKIAVSDAVAFATPLGMLAVETASIEAARALPFVAQMPEAFATEHSLETQLPFIQRALGEVTIAPFLVGGASPEEVRQLLQTVWGGPETAIVISSDLSHFHDQTAAKGLDGDAARAIEMLRGDLLGHDHACGRHGIRGLIEQARRLDMRATAIDLRTSGDMPAGAGNLDRVVGYGAFAFEYAADARLGEAERAELLRVAREVIALGARTGQMPQVNLAPGLVPALKAQRATFVTVTKGGQLRGCVGSVAPQRSLAEDVAVNAYKAAFGDPRFPPLTAEELPAIAVSISILGALNPIPFASEAELVAALRPDVDGVVLREDGSPAGGVPERRGGYQGLFLPQVWEGLPLATEFVRRLKQKAGLPADYWSPTLKAFRFTVEKVA